MSASHSFPSSAVESASGTHRAALAAADGEALLSTIRQEAATLGFGSIGVADVDLRTLGVVMEKNGEIVAMGAGAAVLGHPAAAIAMLANSLAERGEEIPAGSLILSGGITEAVSVAPGDNVTLRIQSLGSTSIRFVE